ncbi:ABC transporter permease [Legionella nagasakiensis]|uniref:ABC transporter permease n=1 Tax=Legionella nagasakiensis TaxID=535290 RepID=UPI0013EF7D63|nr:ABC transporter permease [Legionella nagasakiensis]
MFDLLYTLNKHKRLLTATTINGLSSRFTSSVFGAAWLVLYPLIFLSMYSLIFIFILGVRMPDLSTTHYVLIIFSGLVPFLAFSEAFSVGTLSIIANRGLLRNTLFPIEMVVARDVLIGHATMGLGLILVWVAVLYNGHIYWTQLVIPLIFLFQIIMTLGFVWITSSLTVFFRDIQQAVPIIILFLMLVSPIGYTDEMVPQAMRAIIKLNPLAWLMHLYRQSFLTGVLSIMELVFFGLFSIACCLLGYHLISRLKPIFADYV